MFLTTDIQNKKWINALSPSCDFTGLYTQITSGSLYPSGLSSKSGIVGYSKVTELLGNNGENGRTEYYYHNQEEQVDDFPGIPSVANPLNGKLDSVLVFNASGECLKKNTYSYQIKENNSIPGLKLFTSPIMQGDGNLANDFHYYYRFYNNYSSWVVPISENDYVFSGNKSINTNVVYYYDNSAHRELTRKDVSNSDGSYTIIKYFRPSDYGVVGAGSFVQKMIAQHNISPVIEQQTYLQRDGTMKLTSSIFNSYNIYNGKFYKPDVIYESEINSSLNNFTTATFPSNGTGQVVLDPSYKPHIYFDAYDNLGNVLLMHKPNNTTKAYLWNYNFMYPVAEVTNASQTDIAYTSFEADSKGNWTFSGASSPGEGAITGNQSYSLINGAITKSGLTSANKYIISYWSKGGVAVNGGTQSNSFTGRFINGWTYHEVRVTGTTSVSVSGSGSIDEVRLYPYGTQMTTYTYEPLVGLTSECDANNRITYYEYDSFQRLKQIRDQDNHIIKKFDYQYQQTQ